MTSDTLAGTVVVLVLAVASDSVRVRARLDGGLDDSGGDGGARLGRDLATSLSVTVAIQAVR